MKRMFGAFSVLAIAAAPALAQTPSATYDAVAPSLALVVSGKQNSLTFGTAFCIANSGTRSYYITSGHVVGNDRSPRIVLSSSPSRPLRSAVVRVGTEMDAAILEAPRHCERPLTLSERIPDIGSRVAIAGFPSIQVRLFLAGLGLSPSFHAGAISSLLAGGGAIEYDAQTDHGNSGSPVFDPSSGVVYGIATWVSTGDTGALQNNIAISGALLSDFIRNAHVNASFARGTLASRLRPYLLQKPDQRCLSALSDIRSADIDWSSAYRRASTVSRGGSCPKPRIQKLQDSVALAATPLVARAAYSLTLVNKTPGAELTIAVRNPMHVRDLNAGGCKFTARSTTQEVVSCPKVRTFQPSELEIEITGPNNALCRFFFKDLESGWDVRISGACQMAQTGTSAVTITQSP